MRVAVEVALELEEVAGQAEQEQEVHPEPVLRGLDPVRRRQ